MVVAFKLHADVSPFAMCRRGRDGYRVLFWFFRSRRGASESGVRGSPARAGRHVETLARTAEAADSALEPLDWSALDGWTTDDHSAAFATFLASCRPLLKTILPRGEMRFDVPRPGPHVCRQAVVVGQLAPEQARIFFERNFRPLRITKLGDGAGLLTGYYEPIVDGSRFPTGIFKVPIYRRPRDLVPPPNSTGLGFPNKGQSLRQTISGELVPYYDSRRDPRWRPGWPASGDLLDQRSDGCDVDSDPGLGARAPGRRNNAAHHLRCPQRIPICSGRPRSHRAQTDPA